MESLRAAIGGVVLAAVAVGAADRGRPELVVWVTAAYLTASLLPLAWQRADPVRLLPFANGMLIVATDCPRLGDGADRGPLQPPAVAAVRARDRRDVAGVVSDRAEGDRLAQPALPRRDRSGRGLGSAPGWRAGTRGTPRSRGRPTIAALWAIALSTATFFAINERALRRQNAQLAQLAEMTQYIDATNNAATDIPILLRALREAFGFTRGVVIASPRDELPVLAGLGQPDPPRSSPTAPTH